MEELFAAVKYADTELHNRIKKEADKKFGPKGGYAKNLWVLKEYKKRGGKSSYKGKKPSNDKIKNLIKKIILPFFKSYNIAFLSEEAVDII